MKSLFAICFGILLTVQAQVMLPHRRSVTAYTPFNPGSENTNILGILTGEHPVLYSNKVYVAQWAFYGGTGGVSVVDAYSATIDKSVNIVDKNTDSAPIRDIYDKWHLWSSGGDSSSTGHLYRVDFPTTSVEETLSPGKGIGWESPCLSPDGKQIIVPYSGGGFMAVTVTNYGVSVWTNTSPTVQGWGVTSPSITCAGGYYWWTDHSATLWKLNVADGTTAGSLQPVVETGIYQYFTPIYDEANTNVYFADGTGGRVFCADSIEMTNKWTYSSGLYVHRAGCYYNNRLYLALLNHPGDDRSKIVCLNVTNGTAIWTNSFLWDNYIKNGTPLIDNNYFWVAAYDALFTNMCYMVGLSLTNGTIRSRVPLTFNASSGVPQFWKGKAFCPLWTNGMQAIQIANGGNSADRLWKSDTNHTGNVIDNEGGTLIYRYSAPTCLNTNLISYWWLDEASGTRGDAVGANTLSSTGTTGSTTGIITNGAVIRYDAVVGTNYLSCAGASIAGSNARFSLSCWVNLYALSNSFVLFKGPNNTTTAQTEYSLQLFNSKWYFTVANGASVGQVNTGALPVATNTWYNIVMWYNGGEVAMSVNNGTTFASTYAAGSYDSSGLFYIGGPPAYARGMNGIVDEVGFWRRVLTDDDRTALYNAGAGRTYPF